VSRTSFEHGLVLGKFHPPHAGHEYLIRTALFHCRRVSILVLATSTEAIPMEQRARWLRECFPDAPGLRIVAEVDDVRIDYDDADVWEAHVAIMRHALERDAKEHDEAALPVDVVFSSESYGAELARRFDARNVCLDQTRTLYPVSSTRVRRDLPRHWLLLPPAVRAGLAMRVVVVGAESTGTTTLARDLCTALRARGGVWERTAWVAEYGREYSVNQLAIARAERADAGPTDIAWQEWDFVHIAEEQTRREDEAARHGGPVLVCDTDALATSIWHERYMGCASASVDRVADAMPPRALYLLTDVREVAFEDDGLRDGEHLRSWMTDRFASVLAQRGVPWQLVSGPREERLAAALQHVEEVMPKWWAFTRGH
jgi:HTH-type transcriptional repressor of NAD biosynthesis genes